MVDEKQILCEVFGDSSSDTEDEEDTLAIQAMKFGNLPGWANELSGRIQNAVCSSRCDDLTPGHEDVEKMLPLPSEILWREPLFDQLIANVYEPGEGICGHVDLLRFEDGIAIVSLESTCVMHFSRSKGEIVDEDGYLTKVPVLLNPGSLVLMSGEARYLWKHEINRKPGHQVWEGEEIHQKRRTSVTLRKLCQHI